MTPVARMPFTPRIQGRITSLENPEERLSIWLLAGNPRLRIRSVLFVQQSTLWVIVIIFLHAHRIKGELMPFQLCFNCLNICHSVESCSSKGRCFVCGKKHHTKLHLDERGNQSSTSQITAAHAVTQTTDILKMMTYTARSRPRLLSTVCVTLQSPTGQSMSVRALLDFGAEE